VQQNGVVLSKQLHKEQPQKPLLLSRHRQINKNIEDYMVALDVMGGDHAPRVTIQGAFFAAKRGVPVILFGDKVLMKQELNRLSRSWDRLPLILEHCPDVITMDDDPARSVVSKKQSSLVAAIQSVVDGRAKAVVSAGNSGAALVAGTLFLGRAPGVARPALGSYLPTKKQKVFCLDLGANADCKPEYLEQFALMGHLLVQQERGIKAPRVGLLANGAEPYKGSSLVKKTYKRLQQLPINFVGSVEARDIFNGDVDVLVSDGFSGNVMLKTAQGTAQAVAFWLEQGLTSTYIGKFIYRLVGKRMLSKLHRQVDHTQKSGALLLGLKHPLIVVHGSCGAQAIAQSLMKAHGLIQSDFVPMFNKQLIDLIRSSGSFVHGVPEKIRSIFRFGQKE
jgi:glycerol-3-phosphate acyltransferase PlsX